MQALKRLLDISLPNPLKNDKEVQHLLHLLHTEDPALVENPKLLPRLICILPPDKCISEAIAIMNYGRRHSQSEVLDNECLQAMMSNQSLFNAVLERSPELGIPQESAFISLLKEGFIKGNSRLVDYVLAHPQFKPDKTVLEQVRLQGTPAQYSKLVRRLNDSLDEMPFIY